MKIKATSFLLELGKRPGHEGVRFAGILTIVTLLMIGSTASQNRRATIKTRWTASC